MRIVLVSLIAVAACAGASGSPEGAATPDRTVRVAGVGGTVSITMPTADPSAQHALEFPLAQVWQALPNALDGLGVPVATLDPVKHRMGNEGFTLRHRLKNVALSRYLDCGIGTLGPNADEYDVRLSFMVQARADSAGSTLLTTVVEAAARPATYAQDYSLCRSKGTLESQLLALIRARLAR